MSKTSSFIPFFKYTTGLIAAAAYETLAMLCPPQSCLSCKIPLYGALALCEDCTSELPWQRPGCQRCGVGLDGGEPGNICMNCQHLPPHFDYCMPLFAYQPPVSGMIKRFKQHAGFSEARCLGLLMSAAFRQYYLEQGQAPPAYLLPVPLHRNRLRQRGFNQALMLCNLLSKNSDIPVLRHACERRASQHSQRGLSAQARQLNMQGVFYPGKQAHLTAGQHIAIIDDVVTTTATVNEMSGVLRQASASPQGVVQQERLRQGPSRIDVWCVARAN